MPYHFRIDPASRIVLFKASGNFSRDEVMRCFGDVSSHPDFGRGYDHLVDLRDVDQYGVSASEIRGFAFSDAGEDSKLREARVAVVTSEGHVYGLMRMYEIMMDDSATSVATFRRLEEAAEWLEVSPELLEFFEHDPQGSQA